MSEQAALSTTTSTMRRTSLAHTANRLVSAQVACDVNIVDVPLYEDGTNAKSEVIVL